MELVDVRIDPKLVPEGTKAIVKGIHQQDVYQPMPSLHLPDGKVVSRWSPTAEERWRIVAGEDIYVTLLTFNTPVQPQLVTVGPIDWTRMK